MYANFKFFLKVRMIGVLGPLDNLYQARHLVTNKRLKNISSLQENITVMQ
jgi:hypothetical protein